MKSFKLLLSAAAALVALPALAQASLSDDIARLPKCAQLCLDAAVKATQCSASNQTCMCTDQKFEDTMTNCVMGTCTLQEFMITKNYTSTDCNAPVRDKSGQYVAISDSFSIIAAIFVIQRFAYKIWAKLDIGPDDWFTLITLLSSIPVTIFNAYPMVQNGVGRDAWTLTIDQVVNFVKYFLILEVVYFADIALMKLALLFFYIRIFPSKGVRRLLWATIVAVFLFGIMYVFLATFQCTPIDYYWWQWSGEPGHNGKCIDIMAVGWSNAAVSIAIDAWMLAIPLWQLKSLKLDIRKKIGVAMMFCVGTFVTIVSMLRLRSLVSAGDSTVNPTWDFFDVCIWSSVEVQVGIICVCMPSMRLLLVKLFPSLRGMSTRYYGRSTSAGQRTTARQGSRPLGTGTTSHAERSQHRPDANDNNQITCHTTYTVEYGDKYNDEVQLVNMRDLDGKSARSGSATS